MVANAPFQDRFNLNELLLMLEATEMIGPRSTVKTAVWMAPQTTAGGDGSSATRRPRPPQAAMAPEPHAAQVAIFAAFDHPGAEPMR